jgi:hypothetical protein
MDKLGLGRKMEQAVMRRWEWNDFKTWQPPRAKYSSQDIFELFDFVAVKPWCPVNLVQVKRYRPVELRKAFDAIKSWADAVQCPVAPYLVSWRKDKCLMGLEFQAWEYTMVGWVNGGMWGGTL